MPLALASSPSLKNSSHVVGLVVDQAGGRVVHRHQVGLVIAVRVGVQADHAVDELLLDGLGLAGDLHVEHVGDVLDGLVLQHGLGQAGLGALAQLDDVGVVAGLHTRGNLVGDLLRGLQVDLDVRVQLLVRRDDLLVHIDAVAAFERSELQRDLAAVAGVGAAARGHRGHHGARTDDRNDLLCQSDVLHLFDLLVPLVSRGGRKPKARVPGCCRQHPYRFVQSASVQYVSKKSEI